MPHTAKLITFNRDAGSLVPFSTEAVVRRDDILMLSAINGNYNDKGALLKKAAEGVHFESSFRERKKKRKTFIHMVDTCTCINEKVQRTGSRLDNEKVNELAYDVSFLC